MANLDLTHGGAVTANLNPRGQSVETVHNIVAAILRHVGCATCGRLALLRFDFAGDPPADPANQSVISYQTQGFGR